MRDSRAKSILRQAGYDHVDEVKTEVYMSEHGWELPNYPNKGFDSTLITDAEIFSNIEFTDDELFFAFGGGKRNQELSM